MQDLIIESYGRRWEVRCVECAKPTIESEICHGDEYPYTTDPTGWAVYLGSFYCPDHSKLLMGAGVGETF